MTTSSTVRTSSFPAISSRLRKRFALAAALSGAAVVSACGGGQQSADTTTSTPAATDPGEMMQALSTTTWTTIAVEGQAFAVHGKQTVRYGSGSKWVKAQVNGSGTCTSAYFGSDPTVGVVKHCELRGSSAAPAPATAPATAPTTAPTTAPATAPAPSADNTRDVAPKTGWASQGGGTSGGSAADSSAVMVVKTATELLAAIKAGGSNAKIIKVSGTIDMAAADNGGAFTNTSDQAKRARIGLNSNTTLIGIGNNAGLVNGYVYMKDVQNIVVRNLTIVNPCDVGPIWDPNDGKDGNWNSEYDGVTIDGSKNVWIDHNKFTDAPQTDDLSPVENSKIKQCHDGALDVKNGSDYVTVSNNVFDQHDKNDLIGSSDSKASLDKDHLTVTFHNNLFTRITERAPRVRFGQVHVYNNYYEGSKADAVYPHLYSIGVGYQARIISENNAFDIEGANGCTSVMKNPGSSSKTGAITDTGSLLNGAALNMSQCSFSADVAWTVPYAYGAALLAASDVKASVKGAAGVGKLSVAP